MLLQMCMVRRENGSGHYVLGRSFYSAHDEGYNKTWYQPCRIAAHVSFISSYSGDRYKNRPTFTTICPTQRHCYPQTSGHDMFVCLLTTLFHLQSLPSSPARVCYFQRRARFPSQPKRDAYALRFVYVSYAGRRQLCQLVPNYLRGEA